MKVSYFREMKHHHLMITAGEVLLMDYQAKMIKENEIDGLICPVIRQSNDRTEYDYLITGWQSLQTFAEAQPLSEELLRVVVNDLCVLLEELDRFMIDGSYLCLQPEYIYLEKKGDTPVKVRYCLFPFRKGSFEEQARELFKYMINEVDYQEQAAVTLAYELFQAVQEGIVPSVLKEMTGRNVLTETETRIKEETPNIVEETVREKPVSGKVISGKVISGKVVSVNLGSEKLVSGKPVGQEEILWVDNLYPSERKKGKSQNLLPVKEKRGIISLITKSRR